MDLLAVDVTAAPHVAEGDWLAIDFALPDAAAQSGLSQYELLTGMGQRYVRVVMGEERLAPGKTFIEIDDDRRYALVANMRQNVGVQFELLARRIA
ncbi:hypothetical protein WR25_24476 [Diploscapter pachys]|uniref:Uncharacterized protein n=1 Tax=Diploscapter pachys TaxID=2018661 RepID=A0A2A2K106_9BILA|nr:hypothetical protein WR25_24476 [Diploscapter pachys]